MNVPFIDLKRYEPGFHKALMEKFHLMTLDAQFIGGRDPTRKAAMETCLKTEGIGFGNIYPSVMSKQPGAVAYLKGHFGGQAGDQLCASVLNLPLFPYMTEAELRRVVDVVSACKEVAHVR